MRYLILIYQDEVAHSGWSEQQLAEEYQAYSALDGEFQKISVEMQDGNALMPTQTATTVRVRDGKTLTADEETAIRGPILAKYDHEGSPYYSTARLWDDGILDPVDTRTALALGLSVAFNGPILEPRFGIFRM